MAIIRGYAPSGKDGLRQAIFLFCIICGSGDVDLRNHVAFIYSTDKYNSAKTILLGLRKFLAVAVSVVPVGETRQLLDKFYENRIDIGLLRDLFKGCCCARTVNLNVAAFVIGMLQSYQREHQAGEADGAGEVSLDEILGSENFSILHKIPLSKWDQEVAMVIRLLYDTGMDLFPMPMMFTPVRKCFARGRTMDGLGAVFDFLRQIGMPMHIGDTFQDGTWISCCT